MRIKINWPDPQARATVKCPKLIDIKPEPIWQFTSEIGSAAIKKEKPNGCIDVRECWAVKETEAEDGSVKVEQSCEYFSNIEIGCIVCTYGERGRDFTV